MLSHLGFVLRVIKCLTYAFKETVFGLKKKICEKARVEAMRHKRQLLKESRPEVMVIVRSGKSGDLFGS